MASHWNYVRNGTVYVRCLEKLPNTLLNWFLEGKNVVHLPDGLWNGIWSDMSIKSTYMKIEKDPKGLISQTTQEKAVKILVLSHHLCGEVIAELEGLQEG